MLNARAANLCRQFVDDAETLAVGVELSASQTRIVDCGATAPGGLEAGRRLAEICLAGLGRVSFGPSSHEFGSGLAVGVVTDHPLAACMASQYAGWKIDAAGFFAMASGPMRAAAGKEKLFDAIGFRERPAVAVGVLETRAPEFPTKSAARSRPIVGFPRTI